MTRFADVPMASWNVLAMIVVGYFLPTIISALRRTTATAPIFVLNLFLGWTFVAWVVALVWATGAPKR